jgi:hypothetical protein
MDDEPEYNTDKERLFITKGEPSDCWDAISPKVENFERIMDRIWENKLGVLLLDECFCSKRKQLQKEHGFIKHILEYFK